MPTPRIADNGNIRITRCAKRPAQKGLKCRMAALLVATLRTYLVTRRTVVKTLHIRRALTGLALAAITTVSYAVPDIASEPRIERNEAAPLATAPARAEPSYAGRGSPLTLHVEDSSGNSFQLMRVEGAGWKYAEERKSPGSAAASLFRKVAFRSTTPARPPKEATPGDEPLTVFIDGPSGFTFVWYRESGWKFVGKVSDKSR